MPEFGVPITYVNRPIVQSGVDKQKENHPPLLKGAKSIPSPFDPNDLQIGPSGEKNASLEKVHILGKRPAYFASQQMVDSIERQKIPPSGQKPYEGFNRVSQSLRHIATAVYDGMHTTLGQNPVEVQASVISGKLHISSNFHSDKICQALQAALTQPSPHQPHRPENKLDKEQVRSARNARHIDKLKTDYLENGGRLAEIKMRAKTEIQRGHGVPRGTNLSEAQIITQAHAALEVIRDVIRDAASGTPSFDKIVVHAPPVKQALRQHLPEEVTITRHAEQNIENALAKRENEIYRQAIEKLGQAEDGHVIVPMAGKFVACATCHEVEVQAQRDGGVFDHQNNRFVLHRSSDRIGLAYPDEVQLFAQKALAPLRENAEAKAMAIRDRFNHHPDQLQAYKKPVVREYAFDTDSQSSADEATAEMMPQAKHR